MNKPRDEEIADSIAIVGMAGRFPGANSIGELWRNLCEGRESISFFNDDELDPSVDRALARQATYVKARGMMQDADGFDASLFGISPREAQMTDPQQRIFLETCWEALEDAGCNPRAWRGAIGVYGGTGFNTYLMSHLNKHPGLVEAYGEHQTAIVNAPDYATTRASYKLDLRGPGISLYTGCSLSLVAVCLAYDHLQTFQCDLALAGGAFVWCPLKSGYLYRDGEIFSNDGHCRPFDAKATGTVFSNGVGIVALKRLADAVADGDRIYALIRGTGLNNDGSKKASFTAPNLDGQAEVVAMAHAAADIDPATIGYVEAHGTGTPVGDPVEIAALTQAFRAKTNASGFCAIGSIKSNIGHLDAAAGVAGLIKTALMLRHRVIPPSVNFETPNPRIAFDQTPFFVNTKLREWSAGATPRRAGVSSFGVGGTNAHVVLEEAPDLPPSDPPNEWSLLVLSAGTGTALDRQASNLAAHFEQASTINLSDAAFTLQTGRQGLRHRRFAVCRDPAEARAALSMPDPKRSARLSAQAGRRDVAFMFSGQGTQYVNMGADLYRSQPAFRAGFDRCAGILRNSCSLDLFPLVYPASGNPVDDEALKQTAIAQPALFALEYSLAGLWMSWGVKPAALVGHSIGEYVAACLAGVFSLEDGIRLVAERGRLMQSMQPGTMLAVPLPARDIEPLLSDRLSLATVNAPALCVVSGPADAVAAFAAGLSAKGVAGRELHASHAFHSWMMEPMLDEFAECVRGVERHPPAIPLLSNVTGTWMRPDEAADPRYWARHVREPVLFSDCAGELLKEPRRVLLEVGPGPTLIRLAARHPGMTKEHVTISSLPHAEEQTSATAHILNSVGQLWLSGEDIRWDGLYAGETRRRMDLPTYPFQRKRYWAGEETAPPGNDETDTASEGTDDPARAYAAPGTPVEKELAGLWQKLLGVGRIGLNDDFFELGGSSIIAASLFASIEKMFGKRLPLAVLYEAPTIGKLAAHLGNERPGDAWKCLVGIQGGGTRPPLFLVHGAGGNILIYRELALRLGAEQPVYGLQSQGLDGRQPPLHSIEEMASRYIEEVRAARPHGPYLLGGYCLGGSIAVEMAHQLRTAGEKVALVALFETYDFSKIGQMSIPTKMIHLFQRIEFHGLNFLLLGSKEKCVFVLEKAKVLKARLRIWAGTLMSLVVRNPQQGIGVTSTLSRIWEINDRAAMIYVPKPCAARIAQFLPKRDYVHHAGADLLLDRISQNGIETHRLPIYPAGMMVEPFVRLLAEQLRDSIERALAEPAGQANDTAAASIGPNETGS